MSTYILPFKKITLAHLPQTGSKLAAIGDMFNNLQPLGIEVPNGFAITVDSYHAFILQNKLTETLQKLINTIDKKTHGKLAQVALQCRTLVKNTVLPEDLKSEIINAYQLLSNNQNNLSVAVRSSPMAPDLPEARFAGQHNSFLNISGETNLLDAVQNCYASLFNDQAIKYLLDHNLDHKQVNMAVAVQFMVRSDKGCAGVIFTIDPESGFKNAIYITGAWGLGANVVKGAVTPDEYWVFKPTMMQGKNAIIGRKKGEKEYTLVYDETGNTGQPVKNIETPLDKRNGWTLPDSEILQLGKWSYEIEKHYGFAMDIEWAKDGISNKIYIVEARPETVHSQKEHGKIHTYKLKEKGIVICKGKAVGKKIVSGNACIIHSLSEAHKLNQGDILVADNTSPDWTSLLSKAASIVTNKGGRTSHSAIVARELGIGAIVGAGNATEVIKDGQMITVSITEGDEGMVLDGEVPFEVTATDLSKVPSVETTALLILADPGKAFELSHYPAKGVVLLRMEFIINNSILIHPMALVQFEHLPESPAKNTIAQMTMGYKNKTEYFVNQLAESIAKVAAAFYPNQVILRMSDFKTNEYATLIGGQFYEPKEENPMLGFRGASRYYDQRYKPAFGLECKAVLKVRDEMGLVNVKVMIPFCRTIDEAKKVLKTMESFGLKRGERGLEIYMMIEIPANVILAAQFAELFDGFSIGSNDLTQLTLGLDRDSEIVSHLFDENNQAVTELIAQTIAAAKNAGIKVGLCGQAPSDFPVFSQFLVEHGIDSISFSPDALIRGIENISKAELILSVTT